MLSLTNWLFPAFTQSPQSAIAKVQKLSDNHECLAGKVVKSGYFPLFNVVNGEISENSYKFASNDNRFYMEQDLDRIKLVHVEKKKT